METIDGPGMKTELKVDIGCGSNKREGFIGLDYIPGLNVDHVLDLTKDRFPFDNETVSHVYSSHFLEHIPAPNHVFQEIARICKDGAKIEFWMPYAFSNEAFLYGHVAFLTEEPWLHFCCYHRDTHLEILRGRWLLRRFLPSPHNTHTPIPALVSASFLVSRADHGSINLCRSCVRVLFV